MSNEARPKFSVITSVFNGHDEIGRTIKSVSAQTYRSFEYIVVDGGSKDGTQDILVQHNNVINRWISERDTGIYNAWNKGVKMATGEWICFVGAGDCLLPDALENYHQYIVDNPGLDYVSSLVELRRDNVLVKTLGKAWSWPAFLKYMCVAHVGSMHRSELYKTYGLYDESYRITGDYEFLLRAGADLKAGFFNKTTAIMDAGGVSNATMKVFRETYRAKTQTGKQPKLSAKLDDWVARVKFVLRKALNK
jgi:glycosyltransferase involved in cell wall biosynthesis